jgi:peptide/nickel transport system substrate-binding protein
MSSDRVGDTGEPGGVDRRQFLTRAGTGALSSAALASLLAACGGTSSGPSSSGSSSVSTSGTTSAAGTPRKGGILKIGTLGTGSAESFDPNLANSPSDALRTYMVYDPLTRPAPGFKTEPGLVETWTPNSDATVWELKLREGVTWHDGKPLTADDLIYSLRRMGVPSAIGSGAVAAVKLRDLKKKGQYIVEVPLLKPNGRLSDNFLFYNSAFILQDGFKDFSKPVGTGPFKVTSFTPGQNCVLEANRDYWDEGKPYLDGITVTDIADDQARLNALQSGQIDICSPLTFALAKANQSNPAMKVLVAQGGPGQYIYMRCDAAPFSDVRVRQAMKLIADRNQMVQVALSGFGKIGNDIPGLDLGDYDKSLPQREQDIDRAKSLLKAAGQSGMKVTLQTSPVAAGVVDAATVFSQEAAKAGVTVNVKQVLPASYFSPKLLYLKMPFAQDTWPAASLSSIYETILRSSSGANETHWKSPQADRLLTLAEGAVDPAKRQQLWSQVQEIQYNQGGNIIWASRLSADGLSPKVQGIEPGWLYNDGDHRYWLAWLKS